MRTTSIPALYRTPPAGGPLFFPRRCGPALYVALYVLSDLHLDERGEARMFSDERQGRELSALCERVARQDGAELILLGDVFDFTAMQPPPKGLPEFFRELDVPREERPRRELP
ncbi:MAG TPA: hypothetical protein VE755_03590, partial [Myxococcales bacterium]|nr:hypothetical protein [Myxococcales bacterium]